MLARIATRVASTRLLSDRFRKISSEKYAYYQLQSTKTHYFSEKRYSCFSNSSSSGRENHCTLSFVAASHLMPPIAHLTFQPHDTMLLLARYYSCRRVSVSICVRLSQVGNLLKLLDGSSCCFGKEASFGISHTALGL